jgi:hypothetical protein
MIERPEAQIDTEQVDEETTMSQSRREGGLSTADLAGGRNLKPDDRPADAATASTSARPATTALFPSGESEGFRSRWNETQTGFVDDPRHAVEQADGLVAEVMKRLAESFADERAKLEQQWDRGDQIDTENLRVALQRYRSFFDRLLSM